MISLDNLSSKKKLIIKIIISFVFLAIFLTLVYLFFKQLGLTGISQEQIQLYLEKKGVLAPILFIFITFLQVTFIPIPSTITVLVGNYLFGFWLSYLYSFIGMIIGSMLAFYLGRWFGRKFINWLVSDKSMVDRYLLKIKNKGNILLFFMFLFPFFPDDFLCSVSGIMPISSMAFFIMQVITRGVTILTTLFMLSGDVIPFTGWGIPFNICLCLIFVTLFYIAYKNSEKINKICEKVWRKIYKKL